MYSSEVPGNIPSVPPIIQGGIKVSNIHVDDTTFTIKGVSKWCEGKKVVRMTTFGGGDEVTGDLCCLIHSILKSIDPAMQNDTHASFKNKESTETTNKDHLLHAEARHMIAITMKRDICAYMLSDLAFGKSAKERESMERSIKYKFTLGEVRRFREFHRELVGLPEDASLKDMEALLFDPRTYKFSTNGDSFQYYWPSELRELPLTTGIFDVPAMMEPESDLVTDKYGSFSVPSSGGVNLPTLIESMITQREYGLVTMRIIAQILDINIFLIDAFTGEPRKYTYSCSPTSWNLTLPEMRSRSPDDFELFSYDPNLPCIMIKFQTGHFENIGVVHLRKSPDNREVPVVQTVFSIDDPFIEAFLKRAAKNDNQVYVRPQSSLGFKGEDEEEEESVEEFTKDIKRKLAELDRAVPGFSKSKESRKAIIESQEEKVRVTKYHGF